MSAPLLRSSSKAAAARRSAPKCRAEKIAVPEWVPKEAAPYVTPAVEFLVREDFDIRSTDLYAKAKPYIENEWVIKSTGFKTLPETINGRAAMLGFLAAAGAEIFGRGSFLSQLSSFPQPVLAILALITAGSVIPVVKGTKGEYLSSLRETYTIPEGVFTEPLELLHGRLAMTGLGLLVVVELLKGTAVL